VKVVGALQQCQNCNMSFSWNNIYRSFWGWWGYKPIICDKCGTKHPITISGRFVFSFLTVLPMLAFINFLSPFDNELLTFGAGIFIGFIGSLLATFLVRFKVKNIYTN